MRDALAGAKDELAPECWRVSLALGPTARWTLLHVARDEASPRVRALIVLAAGVHAPDEAVLLESIEDEWPIVRRAAVLATGYAKGGDAKTSQGRELLDGLTVPLGRTIPEETARVLRQRLGREKDAAVRADIASVLSR